MTEDTTRLFRLDSQVAIITGAAGLLGEQHALALSDLGANLALVGRHFSISGPTAHYRSFAAQYAVGELRN